MEPSDTTNPDSPVGTGLPSRGGSTDFSSPPGRKCSVNQSFQAKHPGTAPVVRPGGWPVIVVLGPTGVGKSEVALALAKRISAEIISADSRQVYQHLCVGTAKPVGVWQGGEYRVEGVVHHLVDHVAPTEAYTAGRFVRETGKIIADLAKRIVPAVIAGGTGLYIRSLVRGLAPLPEANGGVRDRLAQRARLEGRASLHAELARIDPDSARSIPPNNIQRVIRALEVHELTGKTLSEIQRKDTRPSPWAYKWFGIKMDPDSYGERLKTRCLSMEGGIVEETRALLSQGVSPSAPGFQSLGYTEAIRLLNGEITKESFSQDLFKQTRLYAKRQMTWFRSEPTLRWLDPGPTTSLVDQILSIAVQS